MNAIALMRLTGPAPGLTRNILQSCPDRRERAPSLEATLRIWPRSGGVTRSSTFPAAARAANTPNSAVRRGSSSRGVNSDRGAALDSARKGLRFLA